MSPSSPSDPTVQPAIREHVTEIRVRYSETDAMGLLHHSQYLCYFEIGRTELFRAQGGSYRIMEEQGLYFVVAKITVNYRRPATFDDLLTLTTAIRQQTPAKLIHEYTLNRGSECLATAESVIACVDKTGVVQRIPEDLIERTRICEN